MRHVILNLHGLGTPRGTLEAGEDLYWIAPDLLREAIALALRHAGQVRVTFTFDDGNRSDMEIGAPLLAEAGFGATHFVLANRIGAEKYLDTAALSELITMGHAIGNHGADHVDWTACDDDTLTTEMHTARDTIATAAGAPVTEAAVPFGRYNARVLRALRAAGYERVYSSDGGTVRGDPWPIPRTSLRADMSAADIEAILLGREPLRTRLRRRVATAVKARI